MSIVFMSIVPTMAAFQLIGHVVPTNRHRLSVPSRWPVMLEAERDDVCLVDEPIVECAVRQQVDGPWADVWARYVLLRPGMTYGELKHATLQRNRLAPDKRIPGTYRTVFLSHLICFIAAIPVLLANDSVFPNLLSAAVSSRLSSGIP